MAKKFAILIIAMLSVACSSGKAEPNVSMKGALRLGLEYGTAESFQAWRLSISYRYDNGWLHDCVIQNVSIIDSTGVRGYTDRVLYHGDVVDVPVEIF